MFSRFLALMLVSQTCFAIDHLIPEDSAYTYGHYPAYNDPVFVYFKSTFKDDVVLRLIVKPSFTPQYALGLRVEDGGYSIFRESASATIREDETVVLSGQDNGTEVPAS